MASAGSPAVPGERIVVLDVLRAVALFGMLVTHFVSEFLAGPAPTEGFGRIYPIDHFVDALVGLCASGKFFSIFAFLFGLGFVIQLENAAKRGEPFAGRFAWRLFILLMIGCVHQMFFTGDVLMNYALLGLGLLPMRSIRNGTLVVLALVLVFNVPGLLADIVHSRHVPTTQQQQAAVEASRVFHEMAQRDFAIKSQGSLADLARLNYGEALEFKGEFLVHSGRLWITFGCFLLGMFAARIRLFAPTPVNRRRMWILLVASLLVAVVSTVLMFMFPPWRIPRHPIQADIEIDAQEVALAAFYIAAVSLLFWRERTPRLLSMLAPVGKMALTSYLARTVFGVSLFYGIGLGLMGKLGAGLAELCAIAFFIVQIVFARLWLARFAMGPVEWLWRSLTDFRWAPLARRLREPVPAAG